MSDPLHNPAYPDCPIWMRITDMPKKQNTNTFSTPYGHRPANEKTPWYLYENDLVSMLERGLNSSEIAAELDLPKAEVDAKIYRFIDSGEYVPKPEE